MDRELGQKRGNGQHDGQHGRYMYEKKGIWLEGSVLTGRAVTEYRSYWRLLARPLERCAAPPLRYAQQIDSRVTKRPKPEA
jgi:hypothetical protein